ncbi:protein DEHYDRATION-INDUCED 19-like [Camellia sinensis]|uniref:protein DEHYDRATION-INDUCED 19-like n=1 Tax=Camellia sinensis TaxID=4442 RepID=UPI0010360FD2|nr:protein DEHYDRATION-INDUCED 19-like [Camellia sinensis]
MAESHCQWMEMVADRPPEIVVEGGFQEKVVAKGSYRQWSSSVIHLGIAISRFNFEHSSVIYLHGFGTLRLLRSEVCPICSIKVVSNMLSHITLQHGHLFKMQRRRRLRRVAIPNSQALSLLGRDLREAHLQVLLGGSGYRSSNANSSNAVNDPFISSLILNFPSSKSKDILKSVLSSADDSSVKSVTSSPIWKASFDPSLSYEKREKRKRQAAERVVFLQDLLVSTLLDD